MVLRYLAKRIRLVKSGFKIAAQKNKTGLTGFKIADFKTRLVMTGFNETSKRLDR